ncbi:MAG TPA: FAD-binding and (Fe-S)-binding domain-containing protein [Thermoanaerobaculia bacterium]|nr:FAD-binding and (Fe-S)-binding domain-containing protein [Thermoanaerobaculia bacterium]
MSREFNRYPPVEFPHDDRAIPPHFEHHDRLQSLSIDAAQLADELRASVRGEVRFDNGSRALYATDASNYRQVPIGIVVPRDENDVINAVALARKHGAPILGRGAGTSLAGQCCNVAVILDMSKYMHAIVEMNPAGKFARVQPGIVLDDLRRAAEMHTLTFGPDPATHAQCTLGGMIGNNSCGVHSIMSGKTVDNIEELEILTYDGVRMRVGATTEEEIASIIASGGRRGEIYAGLRSIRDRYADLIRAKFPRIPRRVSGYNLDELLPENGFHVARALVGSESTCVLVLEAKTKLVYSPPARALLVAGYPSVYEAADDVPRVLQAGPIGLEGFDDLLVRDQQFKKMNPHGIALLPPGNGWLLIEFGGETIDEAMEKAQRLASTFDATYTRVFDNATKEARFVWAVRESGLGATGHVPGKPLMWEGWEDAAVAPEKLGGYLRELRALLERYEYSGDFYGHFGDGCVHTRTNFDLTSKPGIAKFRSFIDEAADLVASLGGSFSGEHGDGQARGALLDKMFGPELMEAFREFKSLWDPEWKMNPGKLILPYQPDENLRLGTDYAPWNPETHFQFTEDHGRMNHAVLRCVGVGRCRRLDGGTMCPSYQVTREEEHSTRGRARLLFEMFEGKTVPSSWRNEAVKESLDLCLACKGCKGDCPTQVDMAMYKSEFLSHYYEGRLRPIQAYTMGGIYWWAGIAQHAPGLANAMSNLPFAKTFAGVAKDRSMPRFAPRTFRQRFAEQSVRPGTKPVVLWTDTFNNHFLPDTAMAAAEVLQRAGYSVTIPRKRLCCGRPLYDWGFLDRAKALLRETLDVLGPELDAGTPIIGLEPSCVSVFRDELLALFPNDPRAVQLAQTTFTLSEFLLREETPLPMLDRKALVQAHCHHKAVMRFDAEEAVLRNIGLDLTHPDSGCCGMAGAFGFEPRNYDLSMKIGERVLLPMVREADEDTLIIANGFSCREQIEQATGRKTLHFAEVLKLAYDAAESPR